MNINQTIQDFNKVFYELPQFTWNNITFLGKKIWKNPLDLWIIQEILYETKPDLLIETGTFMGASALYYATIFDAIGEGVILTIDINQVPDYPKHQRINYLLGDSISEDTFNLVKSLIKEHQYKNIMVILDSDHSTDHVFREIQLYSTFVAVNNYLIVEDTNVGLPLEAVNKFLNERNSLDTQFIVDHSREKLLATFNPSGYLRRVK